MKISQTFDVEVYVTMALVFAILKLTGQVDWAWWTIFLPLVIGFALFILWIYLLQKEGAI